MKCQYILISDPTCVPPVSTTTQSQSSQDVHNNSESNLCDSEASDTESMFSINYNLICS